MLCMYVRGVGVFLYICVHRTQASTIRRAFMVFLPLKSEFGNRPLD